jgi:hypothetical protein
MAISEKRPHGVYFDDASLRVVIFKDIVSPGTMAFDAGDSVVSADTLPYEYEYMTTDVTTHAVVFQANGSAEFVGGGNFYTVAYTDNVIGISQHNILAATGRVSSWDYFY